MCGSTFDGSMIMQRKQLDDSKKRLLNNFDVNSTVESSSRPANTEATSGSYCIFDISEDVLYQTLSHLNFRDVLSFGLTCKVANTLVESERFWLKLCQRWSSKIPLNSWLAQTDSAKSLFRLLLEFDSIVGTWIAQDLAPRGGLLHVSWVRYYEEGFLST